MRACLQYIQFNKLKIFCKMLQNIHGIIHQDKCRKIYYQINHIYNNKIKLLNSPPSSSNNNSKFNNKHNNNNNLKKKKKVQIKKINFLYIYLSINYIKMHNKSHNNN